MTKDFGVKKITSELIKFNKVRIVNFSFKVQEINKELASYLNLENQSGVIVVELDSKSPAFKAGLRNSDVITKVNGTAILSGNDIKLAVSDILVDEEITFDIYRDGKKQTIKFTTKE